MKTQKSYLRTGTNFLLFWVIVAFGIQTDRCTEDRKKSWMTIIFLLLSNEFNTRAASAYPVIQKSLCYSEKVLKLIHDPMINFSFKVIFCLFYENSREGSAHLFTPCLNRDTASILKDSYGRCISNKYNSLVLPLGLLK